MAWTPFTRFDHDRRGLRYTSDLTDAEFALIAPLLPDRPRRGRKRRTDLRAVVNAIFYALQNGCAWADFPRTSRHQTRFTAISGGFDEQGIWAKLQDMLCVASREMESRKPQSSAAIVDSQSVKTGPSAMGDVVILPRKS